MHVNFNKFTVGTLGYHINYVNIESRHQHETFGAESQGPLVAISEKRRLYSKANNLRRTYSWQRDLEESADRTESQFQLSPRAVVKKLSILNKLKAYSIRFQLNYYPNENHSSF